MCSCDIYKYKRRSVVLNFRKDIAMELDTNNHSVFILNYHLIMCVKYRNNVIDDAISLRLKEILKTYALIIIFRWKNGITIKTMFMYCSEDSLIVRFLNLSMLINQQAVDL